MQEDSPALGAGLVSPHVSSKDLWKGSEGFLTLEPDGRQKLMPSFLPQSSFTTQ